MKTTIEDKMSRRPIAVDEKVLACDVLELMRMHGFRHFPVLRDAKIIGVISERDLIKSSHRENWNDVEVGELMSANPLCVHKSTKIHEVASAMGREKYGSVLVTDDDGGLLGVFTTTDALKVLAELSLESSRGWGDRIIGELSDRMRQSMEG